MTSSARIVLAIVAVCAASLTAAGCCDRSGCDAIAGPVTGATIAQGFAGASASPSDVVENGCAACPLGSGALSFYRVDGGLFVEDDVREVLRTERPAFDVNIDGRYEQEAESGTYLVCTFAESDARCLQAEVESGAVTSVHLEGGFVPLPYLVGFSAAGDELDRKWTLFDVNVQGS